MLTRKKKRKANARGETGHAMSEYIVVSLGLALVLLAVINAVNVLVEHHERASTAMQLPL